MNMFDRTPGGSGHFLGRHPRQQDALRPHDPGDRHRHRHRHPHGHGHPGIGPGLPQEHLVHRRGRALRQTGSIGSSIPRRNGSSSKSAGPSPWSRPSALARELTLARAVAPVSRDQAPVQYNKRSARGVRVVGTTDQFLFTGGSAVGQGRFLSAPECGRRPAGVRHRLRGGHQPVSKANRPSGTGSRSASSPSRSSACWRNRATFLGQQRGQPGDHPVAQMFTELSGTTPIGPHSGEGRRTWPSWTKPGRNCAA